MLPPQVLLLGEEPNTGKSAFLTAASEQQKVAWYNVSAEESQRTDATTTPIIACTRTVTLDTDPSSSVPLIVWKSDVKACHLSNVLNSNSNNNTTTNLLNQILQMDKLSSILLFYDPSNRGSYDAIRNVYIPLLLHWAGKMSFQYAGDKRTPRERTRDRNSPIERRGDASWPPIILVANNSQSIEQSCELKEPDRIHQTVVTVEEGLELAEWIRTQHPESQCTADPRHCFDYRSNETHKCLQPMRLEAGTLANVEFVEIQSQSNCNELIRMAAAVSARSYMERRFAEVLCARTRSPDSVALCKAAVLDNAHTCALLLATQRKLMLPSSTAKDARNADVADALDATTDLPAWNTSWAEWDQSNFKEWVHPDPEATVLLHPVFSCGTSKVTEKEKEGKKMEKSNVRCNVS